LVHMKALDQRAVYKENRKSKLQVVAEIFTLH
jgi:hypothetical protein